MILGYGLAMWGGIVLMVAYGLTGMVSRYAKHAGADRQFTAFGICSACWPCPWRCGWLGRATPNNVR
jgi:hypothetical protein